MKLIMIEKVTSDAIVANTAFYLNVETVSKIVSVGTTCTITFNMDSDTAGTVTFTLDGASTAEKLLNAQKVADYMAGLIQDLTGPASNQKGVYELFTTVALFETYTGIVHTGGSLPLATTAIA